MGAASGIGADQNLAAQAEGQLGDGEPGHLDVIGGRIGPGVAGTQRDGQRLTRPGGAVVSEDGQGVEAERLTVD